MKFVIPWMGSDILFKSKEAKNPYSSTKVPPMTERRQPASHSMTQHTSMAKIKGHTRDGATSEIMMNGTGPSPMAKDLESGVSGMGKAQRVDTHITKTSTEMLETATIPVFRP
jgi:hypothetical protein